MIFLIKAFFAMRKIMIGRSRDHLSPEAKEVVLESDNPRGMEQPGLLENLI
jgi:hypothetical protein